MANNMNFPMTKLGKEKLKQELTYLKTVKQKKVVERIKNARSFCDFSEDSEYDAAIKEQSAVKERILLLEQMIQNAKIIKADNENIDVVTLGKTVTFMEIPNGEEEEYTIVGRAEADPLEGKISNDSPIAKSLIGRKVNDKVVIQAPGGNLKVRIIRVH